MIIAHLADLHLGKTVNGYSMIEDQKYILHEIMEILRQEKVNAVVIAGDVYDRTVPGVEAMVLLEQFLSGLQKEGYEVFMIAGNHDSGERLAYGASFLNHMHIHIVGNYTGKIPYHDMKDAYGTVRFHLLPFIHPADVNRYLDDKKVRTYEEALEKALSTVSMGGDRNVILSHQFVSGSQVDENGSEEISVGGIDQVDGHLYDGFDYVALGHIHRPQNLLRETMRYAGTPLKYSFSEADQTKSVPIVTLKEKGNVSVHLVPLKPLHEMREVHGYFDAIVKERPADDTKNDYMHITLNDEEDVTDAVQTLRNIYPHIMKLDYDNIRTRSMNETTPVAKIEHQDPVKVFEQFYEMRNGKKMSDEQKKITVELIDEVMHGKEDS